MRKSASRAVPRRRKVHLLARRKVPVGAKEKVLDSARAKMPKCSAKAVQICSVREMYKGIVDEIFTFDLSMITKHFGLLQN